MSTRYITRYILNTLALVAGAFLAVTSRSFDGGALEWTAFGVSAGVLAVAIGGLVSGRQYRHLAGYGTLAVAAGWSIVASLVFTGGALGWLVLADGIGIGLIALAAAAVHEITTERVVHTLEVDSDIPSGHAVV